MKKKYPFVLAALVLITTNTVCNCTWGYGNQAPNWRVEADSSEPWSGPNTPGAFVRSIIAETTGVSTQSQRGEGSTEYEPREDWGSFYDGIYNRYRN